MTSSGNRVDGLPVIEKLNAAALSPGRHRFWFRAADSGTGQGWYVPVVVLRGENPGPRLVITAGIHGDELNGIAVAHRLIETLDTSRLKGTVVIVPGINTPGLGRLAHGLPSWEWEGLNLNRALPGEDAGPGEAYMRLLWREVLKPNADYAVDLHTRSRGAEYPVYVFADPRLPGVLEMARRLNPDMIKLDPGQKGSIETAFVSGGTPAVTLEMGGPERFQSRIVTRGADGLRNLMIWLKMLPGRSSADEPYVGNKEVEVAADVGGWATLLVQPGDAVRKDQPVAELRDPFGAVRATYQAPVSGMVLMTVTVPVTRPGDPLLSILEHNPSPQCAQGC